MAVQTAEIENITLTIKLEIVTAALQYVCRILSDVPTAAEFVADGLPFFAQNRIDELREGLTENNEYQEELIMFVCDTYAQMRNDLGFFVEN